MSPGRRPSPEYMDSGTRLFLLIVLALLALYIFATPDFADSGITIIRPRKAPSAPESAEPEGGGTDA